jgi:hypothetical protein
MTSGEIKSAIVSRNFFHLSRKYPPKHGLPLRVDSFNTFVMRLRPLTLLWLAILVPASSFAQIDPIKRDLFQFGYNQPMEGHAPVAGYLFFYHNQPNFVRTNLTLRLAVAPVYLDSELGFNHVIGPNTDFGIGLAGGGFADSYNELRGGKYLTDESFDGNGAEISASVYHLFNPQDLIPLNLVLRTAAHYTAYERGDDTAPDFVLPKDNVNFTVRSGLRYGGIEPVLLPALAMELSVWHEITFRNNSDSYGFAGDRSTESRSQLFWTAAALSYTLPKSQQNFFIQIVAGTSLDSDRLNCFRLGGFLPLAAEYPLSLPGYFFQEFSARQFALINASYLLPVTKNQQWNLVFNGASASINYIDGTGQSGHSVSGVGGGILYRSPADKFKCVLACAYGFDAIRSSGRGATSISVLLQWDLEKTYGASFNPVQPGHWRGWSHLFGN